MVVRDKTVQCKLCPWKRSTNAWEIPRGYSYIKHARLANTISLGAISFDPEAPLRLMACHETGDSLDESPCVGWLNHQAGRGNNIAARLWLRRNPEWWDYRVIGPQHQTLKETMPVIENEQDYRTAKVELDNLIAQAPQDDVGKAAVEQLKADVEAYEKAHHPSNQAPDGK